MKQPTKNIKVKKAGEAPDSVVVQKIDVRPNNRTTQDVPKWRSALQSAEARTPRRTQLYDLYADTVLDDQVIAVWSKRVDAVTTANWQFVDKDGIPVDTINQLIDSIGFDEVLEEIMNAKAWGYSMLEPKFFLNSSGKWEVSANLIPRLNMRPEKGIVAFNSNSDDGINIREGIYTKTVMEVGKPKDLGLLLPASLPAILKRGGIGDYAMFVQVYGSPIVDAMWDGFDDKQRIQLLQAIKDMGNGGALVRPAGTEIKLLENKQGGNEPHSNFLTFLNKCISKVLLGTTETTESSNSSGYAQSKTHADQDNNKHDADLTFVRKTLNSRFIKVLEAHGFDTSGGEFNVKGEDTSLTTKEMYEMYSDMRSKGIPIDDDFFYETFGVPKPDNYEELKKGQEKEPPKPPKNKKVDVNGKEVKEEPEEKEVKLSWKQRYETLKSFFLNAPAGTTGANKTTCCGNHHMIKLSASDSFKNAELIKRIADNKGDLTFDMDLFKYTSNTLLKGFYKGFKSDLEKLAYNVGFQYDIDDPAMLTAFEQNLFHFAGTKSLALTQELNELFRKAKNFDEFYKQALERTEVHNKTWLETEYNTALLTGEAAATYHRLMAQADIFPYWEYKTVGDDRVRAEHQKLDGIILSAKDERWNKLFPPNGWSCRCYIVPRLRNEVTEAKLKESKLKADNYLKSTAFEKEVAQGWGVNRALLKEVFTTNQMYMVKHPNKSSKNINNLGASDFKLKSYSQAKKTATEDYPKYQGTSQQFYDALEEFEGVKTIRDYSKRPLHILKDDYERHINKTDDRVILLSALEDTLQNPDEVWSLADRAQKAVEAEKKGDKYKAKIYNEVTYIKYYLNETILVKTHLRNGVLEIKTWVNLWEKKKIIESYRKGLLIQNK